MPTSAFLQQCRELAASQGATPPAPKDNEPEISDADSLIGFFQIVRPDGGSLEPLMPGLPMGEALHTRLMSLYEHAGDNRRPTGGRDAYFVIRRPQPLDPIRAEHLVKQWLAGLTSIAEKLGKLEIVATLSNLPAIRVLEGIPPKHPKRDEEKSTLMRTVTQACATMCEEITDADPHAALLRQAYYFVSCDPTLRDHLMWPFFRDATRLEDPLESYFELWRHGVKYRIFGESQVDLYLPRIHDTPPAKPGIENS